MSVTNMIIDGNNLYARAYHIGKAQGGKDFAVFASTNMILNLISKFKPEGLFIAFDCDGETHKHKLYPEYKGKRPPKPDDYNSQLRRWIQVLLDAQISVYKIAGFEADDVLYTLDKELKGVYNLVVSADKDILQLVTETTNVYNFRHVLKIADVIAKFGVAPHLIHDYLTLVGDSADNLPGINKVGPVKAKQLLAHNPKFVEFVLNDESNPLLLQMNLMYIMTTLSYVNGLEINGTYNTELIHRSIHEIRTYS